jgi:hypothetical protein
MSVVVMEKPQCVLDPQNAAACCIAHLHLEGAWPALQQLQKAYFVHNVKYGSNLCSGIRPLTARHAAAWGSRPRHRQQQQLMGAIRSYTHPHDASSQLQHSGCMHAFKIRERVYRGRVGASCSMQRSASCTHRPAAGLRPTAGLPCGVGQTASDRSS